MTEQNPDAPVDQDPALAPSTGIGETESRSPADDSIVEAVRAGAAPSYASDAYFVDDNGNTVLRPASLPQLTMPELQGLDDPVVPEEGDQELYGLVEDAEPRDPRTEKAVERGQEVAQQWLEDSAKRSNLSASGDGAVDPDSAP